MPAIDYPHADIRRIMEVNVTGAYIVAQAAARIMMEHTLNSSIVMIASMSGQIANRFVFVACKQFNAFSLWGEHRGLSCSAYNTSKGAIHQLSRSLSSEWAGSKIRVNTLSPGCQRLLLSVPS